MKIVTTTLLLATTASALQLPIPKTAGIAATIATSTMLAGPLPAPAIVDVSSTAVVVNIKADIDPVSAAKNLFEHRNHLQDAARDFLADVKQLARDLDGVFPPAPEVAVAVPEDWKQAVRDALVGQARLVVNNQPIYFEVDSKEGFLTVKVLSPILPQLPFLEPTPEQRASMVIPRAPVMKTAPVATTATPSASTAIQTSPTTGLPFWEWSFAVPGTKLDVTLPEAVLGVIVAAYSTTFGYYVLSNALEEQQAAQKKQANAVKAAAAAAKAKVDASRLAADKQ